MSGFFRVRNETRGSEETEARLTDRYGPVALASDGVDMREEHVGDDRFTFSSFDLVGGYSASVDLSGSFSVFQPVAGGGSWQVGRESGVFEHLPVLLQPGVPVTTTLDDGREWFLTLHAAALEDTARALYADDRLVLRFDLDPRPIDARTGGIFRDVLRYGAAIGESLDEELVRASFYRMLALTTLATFRLSGDRRERHETVVALVHAHRRAVAFIDSNASLPITTVDVAQAAQVSLVQLRAAFRAHSLLALTPEQYLRRTRLAAAHTDLQAADPTHGATVRAIATRWGFPDPSTFARHYRTAYGVNPRWTLHR